MVTKQADLAGPGIGNYEELEKALPQDYNSLLSPKDTQQAITIVMRYIEDNLCRQLNLMRVVVPLIVVVESGVNDYLDLNGNHDFYWVYNLKPVAHVNHCFLLFNVTAADIK